MEHYDILVIGGGAAGIAAVKECAGANVLLAFWCACRAGGKGWLLAGLSLVLGGFNLLPVRGLDGGRALYCVLSWGGGPEWAERLCGAVDKVMTILLAAAGAAVLGGGGNLTLLLIAVWLAGAVGAKLPQKRVVKDVRNG